MFQERRFGLFVHWGLYALGGWHEQAQWRLDIPAQDYQEQMHRFRPDAFSASQWLDAVEETGMEYLCFTTKHHDGFCLWDTQATDYKITRTPWGRDPLAELSRECARRNIALSLYYSCPDWHCPYSLNFGGDHQLPRPNPGDTPDLVKYMEYVRLQVRELCTNYGPLAQFFWDIPPGLQVPSFNEEIRRLQPGILINNRGFGPGDYATPERHVPEGGAFTRLTEACQSVGRRSWGYRKDEDYFSPGFLIRSMDRIFAMGGNYLLNVGPDATGTIPPQARQILRQVGEWYRRCGRPGQARAGVGRQPGGDAHPTGQCPLRPSAPGRHQHRFLPGTPRRPTPPGHAPQYRRPSRRLRGTPPRILPIGTLPRGPGTPPG